MIDALLQSLPLAVVAAVPLLLAVEGEVLLQRAGVINLSLEALLLAAAMAAAAVAQWSGSATAGVAAGIAAALLVAALFGTITFAFRGEQIITGAAINLLVLGATGFLHHEMRDLFAQPLPATPSTPFVVLSWVVLPPSIAVLLWRTTFGLRLRSCGENPAAAAASGISVARHRAAVLAIEAVLAGVGGAYLALVLSSGFAENMTAGRGFIALAIVTFGRWRVAGIVAGTALFGATAAIQYAVQATGTAVPFHLLLAAPYMVTLVVLAGLTGRVRAPEALGRS